ncbi:MAG: CDGSH iron-sulfur domain-containing protein [Balneolaceae bacterium]|nr:CDGSH iron-sulfur domain-containing protein [Balneolaceae bacterium]
MKSKIRTYENDDIEVTYDLGRCIHAAECVKGLREVFDPDKRPWIQPDRGEADEVADTVEHCPTGALHYRMKHADREEQVPETNAVVISRDGPVYLRGHIRFEDARGEVILEDTRVALCRCGQSANKPVCDNTHAKVDFEAPSAFSTDSLDSDGGGSAGGSLVVRMMDNGPALVEGAYQLYSDTMLPRNCSDKIALCRCGGSENKPFCDGTHKKIGFEG